MNLTYGKGFFPKVCGPRDLIPIATRTASTASPAGARVSCG